MPTERKILLALFAIALGLRVLYGAVLATQADLVPPPLTSDLAYAQEIASGTRWISQPFSPRSPGYPAVLAALYLASAKQMWLLSFLHAVLGALTVVVVYRLGRQFLGVPFATLAALWFALHVHHMHLSHVFQRDILSVLLLALTLFLLVRPFVKMRFALVSGIVYAALIHVDPQYLILLPVLGAFVLFKTRHRFLNIQYLLVFFAALVVASAPWTIRNWAVYDQALPIGLEAERFLRPARLAVTEPGAGFSEIERKVVTASRARLIERNALEFWRFARLRGPEPAGGASAPPDASTRRSGGPAWSARHNLVSVLNYGILLPFFLAGIAFALRRRDRAGLMLAAVTAVYFLMRAYLGGSERARLPVEPLIVLLAFYGIWGVVGLIRREGPVRSSLSES